MTMILRVIPSLRQSCLLALEAKKRRHRNGNQPLPNWRTCRWNALSVVWLLLLLLLA